MDRLTRDTPLCFQPTSESFDVAAVRAFAKTIVRCRRAEDLQFLSLGRKYQMTEFLRFIHMLHRDFENGLACIVDLPTDTAIIHPFEILGRLALAMTQDVSRSHALGSNLSDPSIETMTADQSEPLADAG